MSKLCRANERDDLIANSFYLCHQNEKCCDEGCCKVHSNTYFQSWYFWLIVTLIFLVFYSCSWYCKNIEKTRKRRLQQEQTGSRSQSLQGSPRRSDVASDVFVECSTNSKNVSKVGEKVFESPPRYQEAVKMPKLISKAHVTQIHVSDEKKNDVVDTPSKDEVPPSYEDAAAVKPTDEKIEK